MGPCFYCKNPNVSICVCIDCRSKFELAKMDLDRLRKDRQIRTAAFFKKQKEKERRKR